METPPKSLVPGPFLRCVAGSFAPQPNGAMASGSPALSAVPREVRPGQALPSWSYHVAVKGYRCDFR